MNTKETRQQNRLAKTYIQGEGRQFIRKYTSKFTQDSKNTTIIWNLYKNEISSNYIGFYSQEQENTYLNISIEKEIEEESIQFMDTT